MMTAMKIIVTMKQCGDMRLLENNHPVIDCCSSSEKKKEKEGRAEKGGRKAGGKHLPLSDNSRKFSPYIYDLPYLLSILILPATSLPPSGQWRRSYYSGEKEGRKIVYGSMEEGRKEEKEKGKDKMETKEGKRQGGRAGGTGGGPACHPPCLGTGSQKPDQTDQVAVVCLPACLPAWELLLILPSYLLPRTRMSPAATTLVSCPSLPQWMGMEA